MSSPLSSSCPRGADLQEAEDDKFLEQLFEETLTFLEANQQFKEGSVQSLFVVYAHDSEEHGPAGQRYVQELIQWLDKINIRIISDKTAVHPSIRRSTGVQGVHNIVETQLCLLPPLAPNLEPEIVDTVAKVIFCGSKILERYVHHEYYRNYKQELQSAFEQVASQAPLQLDTLKRRLKEIVDVQCWDPNFHHVLTELAFLEIRSSRLGNGHGIIPVSVDGSTMTYLPYISGTDIRQGVLEDAKLQKRHLGFFDLLIRLCHDDLREAAYDPTREFRHKVISLARDLYTTAWRHYDSEERHTRGQTAKHIIKQERERADGRLTKLHIGFRSDGYDRHSSQSQIQANRCHQRFKTSIYRDYKDINPRRLDGTCQWVLQHPHFTAWQRNQHSDLLWISADPGCGKSVLSRSLVDKDLVDGQSMICYFFFKDNEEQNRLDTALCAIIHQLLAQQPSLIRYAQAMFEQDGDKVLREKAALWQILENAMSDQTARPMICVLDALDECDDGDRAELVTKLCDLYRRKNTGDVPWKFLVTSRPYDSVERWFTHLILEIPQIRLRGEDENDQIHEEINLVIGERITNLASELGLSAPHQERLKEKLCRMENRTYLWLHLAYEDLRSQYCTALRPDQVRIETVPRDVEDGYQRILKRIDARSTNIAKLVFQIVTGARRPLTVGEMAIALGLAEAHHPTNLHEAVLPEAGLEKRLREWCSLFIFIKGKRIFLIHQTAKDFLLSSSLRLPLENQWMFHFSIEQADLVLASVCLEYLSLYDLSRVTSQEQGVQTASTQLLEYSAEHWSSHLRNEDVKGNERRLKQVLQLCHTTTDIFKEWFPIFRRARFPYKDYSICQDQHVAVLCGQTAALVALSNSDFFEIEARNGQEETILILASEYGYQEMVQWLLARGADVNAQAGYYGNALQAASAGGHDKVVQLLVERGADVNAQGGDYGNALQAASARGHDKVVQLLVERGADVNAQGGDYGNALQAASAGGHDKVVQLLIERGADVNTQGGRYSNALQAASAGGHDKVVQLLIERGADVNAEGGFYSNALQAASARGHDKVVQLLIERGADMNTEGSFYSNALQAASEEGHAKIVQLLIERGADVNAQGGDYGNALQAASEEGHDKVVQLLVERGADVNAQGGLYGNALQAASARGYNKVVQLLVERGADVNAQGGPYDNALQAASATGNHKVVQLLIERGADVNAQGGGYGNALQAALDGGHDKVVQLLVERGADVNAQGGLYGNALQAASARGYNKVVQLLVERGADVNAQGGLYGNALQAASARGYNKVVQLLIERGAGADAQRCQQSKLPPAATHESYEKKRRCSPANESSPRQKDIRDDDTSREIDRVGHASDLVKGKVSRNA